MPFFLISPDVWASRAGRGVAPAEERCLPAYALSVSTAARLKPPPRPMRRLLPRPGSKPSPRLCPCPCAVRRNASARLCSSDSCSCSFVRREDLGAHVIACIRLEVRLRGCCFNCECNARECASVVHRGCMMQCYITIYQCMPFHICWRVGNAYA